MQATIRKEYKVLGGPYEGDTYPKTRDDPHERLRVYKLPCVGAGFPQHSMNPADAKNLPRVAVHDMWNGYWVFRGYE